MAYCTQADILEQLSETVLIQLTDDEDTGEVVAAVVTRAIANADAEIDSYCGSKYAVPFSTVPAIIRAASVDIAIYHLYARRQGAGASEKERYDARIAWLKDVARGLATLGESDPDGVPSEIHMPDITGNDRVFTRDSMEGW